MKVKANVGVKVPFEHNPTQFIEQNTVDVEESLYYRRRIADGDLVLVQESREIKVKKGDK